MGKEPSGTVPGQAANSGNHENQSLPEQKAKSVSDHPLGGSVNDDSDKANKEVTTTTVVTSTISVPGKRIEERAGSAISNQHPECTPPSLSHKSPEKTVEYKEVDLMNTTSETNGDQKDLSCAVPNTPSPPLEEQKEPVVNQDLNGVNTTTDTVVVDAETVRDPAVLERSDFPNAAEEGITYSAGHETTPRQLSDTEGQASEGASRTTMSSTKPQQKTLEARVLLPSSEIKDNKINAQVSRVTGITKKGQSWNFCHFRFFCVNRVKAIQVYYLCILLSEREYCHIRLLYVASLIVTYYEVCCSNKYFYNCFSRANKTLD